VAYGAVRDEHRGLRDVSAREVAVIVPVLALLLVFGVYPRLMTDSVDPATARVIEHVAPEHATTVVTGVEVADPGSAP
jgi:NADH-quinone oxidoreductase subunit M